MKFLDLVKIASHSLVTNKLRTVLTIFGILVGITSIIVVFAAGEGISYLVTSQVESFGTDFIEVEVKIPSDKKGFRAETQRAAAMAMGAQVTTLKLSDMKEIIKLPNIINGYAGLTGQQAVSFDNEMRKAFIMGTNAEYINIDKSEIDKGRFFTENENNSLAKVAILGSKIKEKLFADSDAVGKNIKINGKKFKVIGVMAQRGAVMTMDFDDFVYLPIKTMQKRILGIDHVLYMVFTVKDMNFVESTAKEIRALLRNRHNITPPSMDKTGKIPTNKDDFRVTTMSEMMSVLDIITNAITLLLLAIVLISLLVGGVGVMNIMYVVVSERSQEIGLRKAVGATFNDIMAQFLFEAIFISITGGILGVLIGILLSYLLYLGANSAGMNWFFNVPTKAYVVSMFFSLIFGIVAGVYPARKAAMMEPIEALNKNL